MTAAPETARMVEEALRLHGRTVVRIYGRSMYPALRNGERVLVSPVAYDELVVGDLIVFHDGRGLLCHRLIRKANHLLYLKGDTNLWADPPVRWSQALGRVTGAVDHDLHLRALDTPRQQRRAVLLAHGSYLVALYFHFLHFIGRCRWWQHSTEGEE
jgi:signal peptidase I